MSPSIRLLSALGAATAALLVSFALTAASTPEAEAGEKIWILKFTHEHPKRIQMDDDTKQFKVYWYMPYTITNEDDEEHKFLLDITATSDKGFEYHDGFYPRVAERVRKRLRLEEGDLRTAREVSLALDWSDKVAAVDPEKATPLHACVEMDSEGALERLLADKRIYVDAPDASGRTARDLAAAKAPHLVRCFK